MRRFFFLMLIWLYGCDDGDDHCTHSYEFLTKEEKSKMPIALQKKSFIRSNSMKKDTADYYLKYDKDDMENDELGFERCYYWEFIEQEYTSSDYGSLNYTFRSKNSNFEVKIRNYDFEISSQKINPVFKDSIRLENDTLWVNFSTENGLEELYSKHNKEMWKLLK